MEKLNALSIVTVILSLGLSILCFYYILITLLNKKIMVKTISESLNNSDDKTIIFLFCLVLFMLGTGFILVSAVIILFAYT
jgi:hypothetical protein